MRVCVCVCGTTPYLLTGEAFLSLSKKINKRDLEMDTKGRVTDRQTDRQADHRD